jgi:hypothetical protein
VLIVVGLAIAWGPHGRAELRRDAAIPLGMLIGAVVFLLSVGVGRGATTTVATFGSPNRYISVVVALMLPAVAVAADAVMKRWRAGIPIVLVIIAIGMAGNVKFFVHMMRTPALVATQNATRHMILTLPRLPAATDTPPNFVPNKEGFLAPVTIGWLRDGVASGRIPEPGNVSAGEVANDTLRLSFTQDFGVTQGDLCVAMRPPHIYHLRPGQHLLVGVNHGLARISPTGVSTRGVLPLNVIASAGWTFTATRPATFEVRSTARRDPGSVCLNPNSLAGRPSH